MSTTPKIHNPDNLTPEEYEAADGWRLLYKGELETYPADAEFFYRGEWIRSCFAGKTIPLRVEDSCDTIRTRTPDPYAQKTAHGWIKMSERKPTEADLPVMYGAWADDWVCVSSAVNTSPHPSYTHWMRAPAPPPREPTQFQRDNAAYHEWHRNANGAGTLFAFEAGIAYERAEIAKMMDLMVGEKFTTSWEKIKSRVKGTQ